MFREISPSLETLVARIAFELVHLELNVFSLDGRKWRLCDRFFVFFAQGLSLSTPKYLHVCFETENVAGNSASKRARDTLSS